MLCIILITLIAVILLHIRNLPLRRAFNLRKELRKLKPPKRKIPLPQEGTLIGYAGRKPVYIPDTAKHVFICGTTGSGKTVAISNFIKNVVENDYPALIVDGKGDTGKGSILEIVNQMTAGTNKKVYVVNLSDIAHSDQYNPFRNASPTVAKDMLINMSEWSEEHYKLNAERYLQRILQLMELGKIPYSFKKIVKCISPDKFTELSAFVMKKGLISKDEHLENLEILKTSGKTAQNSTARFSTIAEGEMKRIFTESGIDISQAMQENAIILFVLNPLTFPELSPAFGKLVLIDAKQTISTLYKIKKPRTFFILDEISNYISTGITDLVNKSRTADVTCVLATQSLSDLEFANGGAFKEQIIENCNNYLVMRQNSGVNAEHWANILGTRATMDVTHQLQQRGLDTSETGFGSARIVREFLYHPDDIKTLGTGKGIFLSRDTNYTKKIDINKPF